MTQRRLIEEAFPLKKVSEDSSHEKMCHAGHIKSLHSWPARRPLAACRAAIIAALMPDPGTEAGRDELCKKIASITRWGTENGPALDYFREEIRKAHGGRAPRVLDPFAGGGAIPLEAMRLGCDVVANDYSPVAWFILKCTLEFPQRLAGRTWPLPGTSEGASKPGGQMALMSEEAEKPGDLADHVRYWGNWVLQRARAELAPFYPTVDGHPTVAYLWARTVPCPDPACGAEVPLLKTLWLCTKPEKVLPDTPENRGRVDFLRLKRTRNTSRVIINGRRALRLVPQQEGGGVSFEVWVPGPHDSVPPGTMIGAKSRCPICGVNLTPAYIKECGHSGRMGARMSVAVTDTGEIKDYRLPTREEVAAAEQAASALGNAADQIPYGLPTEQQRKNPRTLIVQLYGLLTWASLFTPRQLLALAVLSKWTRAVGEEMLAHGYAEEWVEAVVGYLACVVDKLADYNSAIVTWQPPGEKGGHTFARWALPMTWDFMESNPILSGSATYHSVLDWVSKPLEDLTFAASAPSPTVLNVSATGPLGHTVDVVVTDPPYYTAIPYADLCDFFYVWMRRILGDRYTGQFGPAVSNKDEELALRLPHVDISEDHTPDWYEQGMASAFRQAHESLVSDGRLAIVFAHKDPQAWETLVTAMIGVGFTVTASWPIDTEMSNRTRAMSSAALASSIWMICRKRAEGAGVGRYAAVRRAMQERVTERLRYFWDVGISGPDFVWAAVGPALESYSAFDEVRRLDGSPFTVGEFLREVRRMVADFSLGKILHGRSTEGLDEWTRYYLMHRSYFGLEPAPVGECILLSQGYGLDLNELRGPRGLLLKASQQEEADTEEKAPGSGVRLARWDERTRDDLGEPHAGVGLPMVDGLHRLMHLWAAGNLDALGGYAAERGLHNNDLFWEVAQAVLEMAAPKSRERTLLEAVVAWGRGKSPDVQPAQAGLWDGIKPRTGSE